MSSPWNSGADGGIWQYRICTDCTLRYVADEPRCPRCRKVEVAQALTGRELGGFLARREEAPVLDEEDRIPPASLVVPWAQWHGEVRGRWTVAGARSLRLARGEDVRWLNEGRPPTEADRSAGRPLLHGEALGHSLCTACGRLLSPPAPENNGRGRRQARRQGPDPYGHAEQCPQIASPPEPVALVARGTADTLRLVLPVPPDTVTPEGPHRTSGCGGTASATRCGKVSVTSIC